MPKKDVEITASTVQRTSNVHRQLRWTNFLIANTSNSLCFLALYSPSCLETTSQGMGNNANGQRKLLPESPRSVHCPPTTPNAPFLFQSDSQIFANYGNSTFFSVENRGYFFETNLPSEQHIFAWPEQGLRVYHPLEVKSIQAEDVSVEIEVEDWVMKLDPPFLGFRHICCSRVFSFSPSSRHSLLITSQYSLVWGHWLMTGAFCGQIFSAVRTSLLLSSRSYLTPREVFTPWEVVTHLCTGRVVTLLLTVLNPPGKL